jgi:hypothetical protein
MDNPYSIRRRRASAVAREETNTNVEKAEMDQAQARDFGVHGE